MLRDGENPGSKGDQFEKNKDNNADYCAYIYFCRNCFTDLGRSEFKKNYGRF